MRLRNTDRAPRSSGRRSNVASWISEVKDTSNVAVRKKRGRRAPPSAKRLRDKRVDKAIESDGAVDSDSDDTDGQVGKSQPSAHIEEQEGPSSASEEQDHSTNSKDMLQKASSQSTKKVSRSSTSSKQGAPHLEQEGANEDGSHVQVAAVYKDMDNERSSQEIRDDVSDAQVDTTSSNDKSSEEVEDVKVCDICGDVGEDEKLAVCSRCNDGAEHTYCMRVMMEEVPDSDWLCEDCQTAVESEKENRLEKSQVKVGTSKELSFEGEINKPPIAAKNRNSSDCKMKAENVEKKESDTTNEGNDTVETRMEEDAAMTSSIRDTIPETGGMYTGADSRKTMQPSHEIFMFDADKGKQPSHQVATSLAFNALKNQAPQPRGQLSKSTSFNNSKVPKVKQLLNEVPQKPKFFKESWSSIIKKEGPISMTTKSATFKKPKPCEPANKAKSSVLPPAEEPRVTNQLVSHNVTNGQCSSILGPPSATASMVAPVLLKTDTTAQLLSTRNNMADSNNLGAVHVQGGKNSLGNSELKKPPLAKVPGSTMLSNAERSSCGILGSGAHRKVIQNSDSSHQDTKIKDQTGFRQGASSSSRNVKKPSLSTQANEQDMRYILSIPGSGVDCSKLKFKDTHPSLSATPGISSDNGCIMPNDHRDEPAQGVSAGDEPLFSTVPELDWIWQGGFELQRTGRSPELCDGFQAHLSCSAAQLVLDVVKKFPSKVQLEEVPRQNSWPTQFQENGPTYDNIGLFFFARDVQSYEKHYSKLVENMLKNDLVLRGSVGTVELLIFPSNILSKNFQRWNMFYFLWGLFRVGKKDSSNLPSYVSTSRLERNFNDDPGAMDWSTTALSYTHSFSQNRSGFGEILVKSTNFAPSLEASHEVCLNGENFLNQPVCGRGLDDHLDSDTEIISTISNGGMGPSSMSMQRKHQKLDYPEHEDRMRDTFGGNVSERDFDVNMVPVTCSVSLTHLQEEPGMVSTTINLNDADNLMDIDHVNTWEVSEGALDHSHASGGADKRSFEMAKVADEVDEVPEHKKIKLDNVVSMNSDLYENAYNGRLSSKVHSLSASSVNDGTSNKPMAGSSSSDGKCVFPLDLNAVDDAVSENIVNHY
ncbi:ASI1-immunoprecipitated protein 2-like isoform X2 [Miscanthus floridulus]|uniref:ASI1-immunoprecipitated protein 2-like isoform X2 n=1 Tax=Miscanthus floridulus TaxID=154761 RepID=UPI003457A4C4